MRYEDASGTDSFSANEAAQSSTLSAHNDADVILAGKFGPATGNAITGAGTVSGSAGADSIASGHATISAIQGAGGTDTSFSGGHLQIAGQYGVLTMDAEGNYSYVRNHGTPNGVSDVFNYTLSASDGATDIATLTINIGKTPTVIQANAVQVVPGPNGVVTLPAGVELSDIHVVGRNLVIDMPDGSQMVIVDGAVFVPQLVLGTVEVPSTNLAALLIDSEPQPAAGPPQSSGGNFEVPVPPLDPGTPLGDLIPPTELSFPPIDVQEVANAEEQDDSPLAGLASAQLDDDAQPGGNPGGVGDDPGGSSASGLLPGSGGDGSLIWDLLSSGAPAGFSYVDGPNGSILVQQVQGGPTVTVLTITVNPATGDYTVTQNAAVWHAPGGDENNAIFVIDFTVTDSDGDVAAGTLTVNVDDDTPTVTVTAGSDAEVILTTHDAATIGAASEAVSTSVNFGGVFTGTVVSPGADGAGSGTSSGYALSTTGVSGLTQGGVAINLYSVGGVIIGSTSATSGGINAANTVFSVSVSATGVVTLTQFSQIDHTNADPSPTGTPFTDHVISMTDGSITLTRSETVVDKDGDSVTGSASVGIGANLHFVDDGPSISLADHGEPTLTVDETDFAVNDTQSFAANFSASFGADGPAAASVTYALGINAGATGLIDSLTGEAVILSVNGSGAVEGRTATTNALVFTVSVDGSGNVTLDQSRAVIHDTASDPDTSEGTSLASDNLVTLTATAHDFDGDTASATLNIGQNLNLLDDGPTVSASGTEATLTVDETSLAVDDTQSFASAFTDDFGHDGPATSNSSTYLLGINAGATGLVDSLTGEAIVLSVNGSGAVEGRTATTDALVFTVSVDGSGNVTLDQARAVIHTPDTGSNQSATLASDDLVTLTHTITDADGDSAHATINIGQNLNFLDDGPSVTLNAIVEPSLTVDETNFGGDAGPTSFAGMFNFNFGADGPAASDSKQFNLGIGAGSTGLVDSLTGEDVVLSLESGTVVGRAGVGGSIVLVISVDSDGNVSLDQQRAVIHADPNDPNDSITFASDNLITLSATVTDADGDSATISAPLAIAQDFHFLDDGPTATDDSDNVGSGLSVATGNVITGVDFVGGDANATDGTADDPGHDGFGGITAIHSNGTDTTDTTFSGGLLSVVGSNGTLTIDVDGNYTYTRAGGSPGNVEETFTYTYKDGDGDTATANLVISITDATPQATTPPLIIIDDDDVNVNGNPGTPAVNDDAPQNTSGTLTGTGGDGDLDVFFSASQSIPGFIVAIDNSVLGQQTLTVSQGATVIFTVVLTNESGVYTVTQNNPLAHAAGNLENNADFGISFFVKDFDGSQSAPATMTVRVDDDTPIVTLATVTEPTLTVDETNLAANAGPTSFAALFTQSFGADGPAAAGSSTWTLGISAPSANSGLIDVATGSAIVLVLNGAVVEGHVATAGGALAFTVSVNASGGVSLDQIRALQHPDANNPNDSVTLSADNLVTLTHTITDSDGDPASATANIGQNLIFLDDGPSISASATQPTLTVDETNLATNATASFVAVFTSAFGADGAGTVTYALGISAPSANSGLIDVATGSAIVLVLNGAVVEGHVGNAAGALAFTVTVNAAGDVTLDQLRALQHPDANNSNDSVTLSADNLVTLTATVTDKDGDHQSATANIGQNLAFLDDGPSISPAAVTEPTLTVDETVLATNASASFAASFTSAFGADGAGAVTYALTILSPGVASGLTDTATGLSIVLVNNAGLIEGHVGSAVGALAFTVSVNAAGSVTLDQIRAVVHNVSSDPDTSEAAGLSADNLIQLTATVTDKDGDHQSATLNIGSNLSFLDDGPVITAASNMNIQNSGDVAHTAAFVYNLGADGAPISNNVFTLVTGSATVNSVAVTNYTISETSENATSAVYTFGFDYPVGGGATAHETGTLTFNKGSGTYTVELDNPIQGTSIVQTATGTLFQGYEPGGAVLDGSQPAVSVTQVAPNLFVQFTSVAEPSSGTGANNLRTVDISSSTGVTSGTDDTGADAAEWHAGELFDQTASWVSTSNSSNGVAGDTIQGGEVLDFNLYNSNPFGNLGNEATANANTMFLKFDGIGSSEDMIVILKLYDTVTDTYTTKALIIENGDIQKGPGVGPGIFSGITLDNNDGLIVIEPNDYQGGNTNLVIVGAQLAGSDEGITGSGINFNNALGVASTAPQAFTADVDDGPMKISSIGFVTTTTTAQNAELTFNVTLQDGDGDTDSITLHATITASADSTSPITITPVVLDLNGDGAQFLGTDAGVHYDYGNGSVATAWADPNDGILVRDANGNGTVDNASEFVFGHDGQTDLQALAAQYGSALDANDADFGKFAVWQDANSNGVADAGEVTSLTDAGINSISLSSDGIAYEAANGDVVVAGTGSFTRSDGSTGKLADAIFVTESERNAANTNTVLIAALAAAGVAAAPAAAQPADLSSASTVAIAAAIVASTAPAVADNDDGSRSALGGETKEAASDDSSQAASASASPSSDDQSGGHSLTPSSDSSPATAPTDLLEATNAPASAPANDIVAPTVAMPSAQQLVAASNENGSEGTQSNAVVGKVLVDALHGGGAEQSIDALLASLPGHGNGANAAADALASQPVAAVPTWDTGHLGAFTAHANFTIEAVALHHDAVQPVANG